MENTVVGVYDSYAKAQSAMNELVACGFSRSDIQLSPDSQATMTAQAGSKESGIVHFFRSLFGMEEDRIDRDVYSEAVRRGSCVLTVNAASDELRDRATDVMNRYDPVDIDERSSHWRSKGWAGYDESAPLLTDSEIQQDRSDYEAARSTAAQRGGVRAYSRVTEQPATDDSDFRTHWQTAYGQSGGRYEDYDAAYRYGSTMAGTERYRNYRWEDAEPDMRSEWETSHPESTWEKVKDAVRYGAERVTGKRY